MIFLTLRRSVDRPRSTASRATGSDPGRGLLCALLCSLLCTVAGSTASAQPPDEPLESPKAVVSQVLGTQPITITYWSPGVKDREIWGELVPFGQNWRAGANGKTTIEFSQPVLIDETRLEAGRYGFYVLPHSDEKWELVLNSDPEGSPNTFDPANDVMRLTVTPEEAPFRERLQYAIEDFSDWPPFTAEIALHWERRRVVLPVRLVDGDESAATDGQ